MHFWIQRANGASTMALPMAALLPGSVFQLQPTHTCLSVSAESVVLHPIQKAFSSKCWRTLAQPRLCACITFCSDSAHGHRNTFQELQPGRLKITQDRCWGQEPSWEHTNTAELQHKLQCSLAEPCIPPQVESPHKSSSHTDLARDETTSHNFATEDWVWTPAHEQQSREQPLCKSSYQRQ